MFKRAFLAAIAVLMMPALAMAQSTVTFNVGVFYGGVDAADAIPVDATLSCNAGLPLEQTASVGDGDDRVLFTVTELPAVANCTVSFGDAPADWEIDVVSGASDVPDNANFADACAFGDGDGEVAIGSENACTAYYVPAPVDFAVTVNWDISADADVGVGDFAYAELYCYGLGTDGNGMASTTLDADPEADMPLVLADLTPDPDGTSYCYAYLYGTGSAVEVDNACSDIDLLAGGDSSCTITATAFYEGVPTLSQYGMAIMVLLMLGMGFVGFRRFV